MARNGKVHAVRWGNRLRLIKGTRRQVEGYILQDYAIATATVQDGIEAQKADLAIEDASTGAEGE